MQTGSFQSGLLPSAGIGIDLFKADAVDPILMQRIRAYDRDLLVYYDSNVARYGVARVTPDGIRFIALWQDDNGGFLPLDSRLLDAIASWDLRPAWKQGAKNADEDCKRRDEADLARAAKADSDFDDDISHLTRANRRQLAKAIELAT